MKIRKLTLSQALRKLEKAREKCPGSRYERDLVNHIVRRRAKKKKEVRNDRVAMDTSRENGN